MQATPMKKYIGSFANALGSSSGPPSASITTRIMTRGISE